MICFLTSQTVAPETGDLNPANGFIDELRLCFPDPCRALFICSNPAGWAETDYYAALSRAEYARAGFQIAELRTLDSRNAEQAAALVRESNLLILAGGHVPTQNRFFRQIRLRALLQGFDGVLIGVSAGSMNSAELVYAQPELEGEAVDPAYQRFLPGLGLTKTMLLPHYQKVKDDWLDGLRLFADITCPDSMGISFYAIPDGSYLLICSSREELRGEAYRIRDGRIAQISKCGETIRFEPRES